MFSLAYRQEATLRGAEGAEAREGREDRENTSVGGAFTWLRPPPGRQVVLSQRVFTFRSLAR